MCEFSRCCICFDRKETYSIQTEGPIFADHWLNGLLLSTQFDCVLYGKMCTLQEITGKQFNNGFIHSSSKGLLLGCLSFIAKLSFTCAWNISSCCSFQSSSSSAVLYSSVSRGSVTGGGLGWAGGTRCGSERGMALDVWLLSSEEERLY